MVGLQWKGLAISENQDGESQTYEDSLPLVKQISRTLARRYPPVEQQDIEQELCAYLWKARARILPRGPRWINFELTRQGAKWCRKQRADKLNRDDQYFYTPEDTDRALDYFFNREDWSDFNGPVDDIVYSDGSSGGQVIYHDDRLGGVSMLLDMRRVWDDLKLDSQQALFYTHAMGLSCEQYAEQAEIEPEAARKRLQRARAELVRVLNARTYEREYQNDNGGPGTRQIMSNTQAGFVTGNEYSG